MNGITITGNVTINQGVTIGQDGGGGSAPVTTGASVTVAARGATYTYDMTTYITGTFTSLNITGAPDQGTAVVVGGNSIQYTAPNTGTPGTTLITYTATNAYGTSNASVIVVTLNCCVVANALTGEGLWSRREYMAMHTWGAARLDKHYIGRALHRGYDVIAPKLMVPHVKKPKSLLGKYMKWTFENGTQLLRGKKYDLLSVPNSALWIAAMTITGLFTKDTKYKGK
jgi:hypothetical protein